MKTYTVRLQPAYRFGARGVQDLTAEIVGRSMEGALVRQLATTPYGQVIVDLALQRPTHDEALDEIAVTFQQLGYSIVSATASEWVSSWVEGAVLGALGCGGIGSASKNTDFAFLAAVAGMIAGAIAGSSIRRERMIYHVSRDYQGRWHLTPAQPQPQPVLWPGLA